MSRIELDRGVPFVNGTLFHDGHSVMLRLLVDTGAGTTLLSVERLQVGLVATGSEPLIEIFGVGGSEFGYETRIARLSVGNLTVLDFVIEAGATDYGMNMDGILGMNFLRQTGTVIDVADLRLRSKRKRRKP